MRKRRTGLVVTRGRAKDSVVVLTPRQGEGSVVLLLPGRGRLLLTTREVPDR